MKKILYFYLIVLLMLFVSGCGKEEIKINSDSQLAVAKRVMTEVLDNYSYDAEITIKTGIMDITSKMSCKDDRKNEVSYCLIDTYGVETEEYIDYKNKMVYSKVTTAFGGDSSNGKWTSTKYNGGDTNAWINLSDYIFNINEEKRDGGTYYTGTIDNKKLAVAVSQVDSNIDTSNIVSDDIDINVFVNSSNYIEKMSFTIEIMGVSEEVEVKYKDFNMSGDIVIPSEVKKS